MISIAVIASKRRRNSVGLRITDKDTLELRIPSRVDIKMLSDFLSKNTKFLKKASRMEKVVVVKSSLSEGYMIYILGTEYLMHFERARKTEIIIDEDSRVVVVKKPGNQTIAKRKFYEHTKPFLLNIVEDLSRQYAQKLNTKPLKEVRIKQVKSLWGSCSSTQNITYNARLIHYPIEAINYILIHEVSHLLQPNHSKKFWDIVERECPDYKELRKVFKTSRYG